MVNLRGVDAPYKAPEAPDLHLKTVGRARDEMVEEIEGWLRERGFC